ncbi:putative harbinger transposase-derived protein [Tanacetum coccineum]|uniref:Harbinger transposase-derived protein n=1 Tax=Tanacetum coccineum TaxID=301880 RepID=A0ABQ5IUU3_9ASTR
MSTDSDSKSISSDSDSSSISSNSIEYHEWESRVVQYDQHIDRILEDVINYPNLGNLSKKCTAAMRVLAYWASFDVVDEYLRMSGVVTRKSLMAFVRGIISCFGGTYLRRPNEDDLARLLYVGEQRGFPGSCNDINVLHRSLIFSDVLEGRAPKVSYVVNGHQRNMAYYLADGIYPSWAAFVKSITSP